MLKKVTICFELHNINLIFLSLLNRVFCFVKNFNHPYSNWILENLDHYNFKDILLDEIYQEVRYSSPKDDLPNSIKTKLEKLTRNERKGM